METTPPPLQFMTNAEVSATMKVSAATTRSRIHRTTKGKSSPDFPEPLGKIAGAWIWDRAAVDQFAAEKASPEEVKT